MINYQIIIAPVADSVERLRAIDLDRVLMNADENFPQERDRFVHWLERQRLDLCGRIRTVIDDLIEEGLWTTLDAKAAAAWNGYLRRSRG